MPNTIRNLQALFDKNEQMTFLQMMVKTKKAIKAFKDDPDLAATSIKTFEVEDSDYTRDRHCEIDFTMLNTTISLAMDTPENEKVLNQSIDEVSVKVDDLMQSLNLFIKMDTNSGRTKIYQDALTYLAKIKHCFEPDDHKNDSSASVRFKI
jgi:hypothetical protein